MNLTNRPRRLRNGALLRSMVRETRISADTLIYPMFVQEGEHIREEIPSMPGQYRWSLDCVGRGFRREKRAAFRNPCSKR